MSLPLEPTRLPQGKEMGNVSPPAERSEPLLSSQESHLRPNRRAPGGESSTGWLSALKARALPLAALSLVLNLIFIVVIIILSTRPAYPVASCPDGWIEYWGKCYYFSELHANWTDSQKNCSALGASLAGIDSQQEKAFLVCNTGYNTGSLNHWIGLRRELGQAWKWANGTEFNNSFPIAGGEQCAFLSGNNVASKGCRSSQPWICSKPA